MTSYLRKYVTALASARDYVAQWSSDHVFADEELIVPFPTIARFDPEKHVWNVNIKAWVYLPFQPKSFTDYLPSLPTLFVGKKNEETTTKVSADSIEDGANKKEKTIFNEEDQLKTTTMESQPADREKVDQDKKDAAAAASEGNRQEKQKDALSESEIDSDDDIYEDALRKYSFLSIRIQLLISV